MKVEKEEKASSDGENAEFQERSSEMDRIVLHSEVPAARTCANGPNVTPGNLGDLRKDMLNCITCAAQFTTSFFKNGNFDVNSSAIVQLYKDMKKTHGFEHLTKADRIAKLA
eukprot:5136335-Heterocapsa_arctica.AAC.1